jgi:hypothetical protein
MSKETEPVRSRRELRAAKSEESSSTAGNPPVPAPPAVTQPPVDVAVPQQPAAVAAPPAATPATPADDAASVPRERSSQTRARDRAALRAYKELLDAPPTQENQLPSRRALRQAQLDAERAPVTSINLVVPPAAIKPAPTRPPTVQGVAPAPTSKAAPGQAASDAPAKADTVEPANPTAPASAPIQPARTRAGRRSAGPAVGATAAGAPQEPAASGTAPSGSLTPVPAPAPTAAGGPGAATAAQAPAEPAAAPAIVPAPPRVEPAAAIAMPLNTVGPGSSAKQAPTAEELRLLAEQRAQAERAAVLNQRAQARERLAAESAKNRRAPADPTATNNLAMVTPLEFVKVPGVDRPVLRPPVTTHVPIVTKSTPTQAPARKAAPRTDADRFDAALSARSAHRPGPGNRPLTGNRSHTLKRAEAMAAVGETAATATATAPATAAPVTRTQMPPMPADYAHGLEPLDAVTAGLGRTQRNMLIQWGSIILGGAALIAGAVMFITSLAH